MPQRFELGCTACGGGGQVAIVRVRPADPIALMVPQLVNKPMTVSVAQARELLRGYNRRRSGIGRPFDAKDALVRSLAARVTTTQCPRCRGTGVAHTLIFGEPEKDP